MNNINKEFCHYVQSLEMKLIGFNELCIAHYAKRSKYGKVFLNIEKSQYNIVKTNNNIYIDAPIFSQAFRWFREKHNLFGCIDLHTSTPIHWYIRIDDIIKNDYIYHSEDNDLKFKTYEEAELACLKKLIEIVETKQI
jgi:hypothetical protein